jgi:hypothetical protein
MFARKSFMLVAAMVAMLVIGVVSVAAQATPVPLFPSSAEVLTDSTSFLGTLGIMPLVVAGAIVGLAIFLVRRVRSATR